MAENSIVKFFGGLSGSCGSRRERRCNRYSHKRPMKSCVPDVIKKLRRHPDYQHHALENQLKLEAEDLTDADRILERYFSSITHDPLYKRVKESTSKCRGYLDTYERRTAMHRVEDVARLQVKLLLRYVNKQAMPPPRFIGKLASALQMEYGPLHASLLINNTILLEWNSTSLVIPKLVDPYSTAQTGPILVSATVSDHMQIQRHLSQSFESYDEVELLFDAASKKIDLLRNLAGVIARYNSVCCYDLIFKNCQTFVLDALKALGCRDKPHFGGNLKEYFTHLKKEGFVRAGFQSHEQLNAYVIENRASLTQEKMEYLLAQYFLFHMQNVAESGDWRCRDANCMMDYLEAKIDEKALIMHRYLRPSDTHLTCTHTMLSSQ